MNRDTILERLDRLYEMIQECPYNAAAKMYSPEEVRGHSAYVGSHIKDMRFGGVRMLDRDVMANMNNLFKNYKEFTSGDK